jgi:hypothetical protein
MLWIARQDRFDSEHACSRALSFAGRFSLEGLDHLRDAGAIDFGRQVSPAGYGGECNGLDRGIAHRGARERCLLTDYCGILTGTKSRLRSLGMRQNSSLDGSLKATRRLPEGCGGRQGIARSACEGLNPHRDRLGLPRGFVQPASIRS